MVVSFYALFFFPRGVLNEILNLIESVSGEFPFYSCTLEVVWDFTFFGSLTYFFAETLIIMHLLNS